MPSILTDRRLSRTFLAWVALGAAALSAAACDKLPLLAPGLSTITLSTDTGVVQANGTANVSATVLESSGTPVQNGTTVTFTTNLGTLAPTAARTVNGVATVQFVASGSSGVAEIRATSGAAKPSDTANPSLKLVVGGAAASRITVAASPSSVPASGGISTITATVLDTSGNPLRNVTISFSTTEGSLSSAFSSTNANGQAQTSLTTSREATVTASAGAAAGGTTSTTGTVVVRVNAAGTVTVAASPSPAVAGQPVSVSVTLASVAGGSAVQRVVLDYGDGSSTTLGGSSTTVPHTYARSGTYIIRATAFDALGDSFSGTATLVVGAAPRPTVSISGTAGTTAATAGVVTFSITVTPVTGVPIDEVTVSFGDGSSANLGALSGTNPVQHTYQSAGEYVATVNAEDQNGAESSASTPIVVPPLVTISFDKSGNLVSFTAIVRPLGTSIASYFWDFGDGETRTTTGNQQSHVYTPSTTARTVTVSATTPSGQTGTGTASVTVP